MTSAELPFPVLFEDQHLIVLSKPAGLLSQGDQSGDESLVDILRGYFGRHYVGLIHRLDRNTSGCMVVAKRTKAANRLTDALTSGELKRIYLGLMYGTFKGAAVWKHWVLKDEEQNKVEVVPSRRPQAKEAVLAVREIGPGKCGAQTLTLARFELETGRSHQIRVQAAAEGFPLLGDIKYGWPETRTADQKFGRPALHSAEISFPHPMSGEVMRFEAPLPEDMKRLLNR